MARGVPDGGVDGALFVFVFYLFWVCWLLQSIIETTRHVVHVGRLSQAHSRTHPAVVHELEGLGLLEVGGVGGHCLGLLLEAVAAALVRS